MANAVKEIHRISPHFLQKLGLLPWNYNPHYCIITMIEGAMGHLNTKVGDRDRKTPKTHSKNHRISYKNSPH